MLEGPMRQGCLLAAMVLGLLVVLVSLHRAKEQALLSSPLPASVMGTDLTGMYAHSAPLVTFVPVPEESRFVPYRGSVSFEAPASVLEYPPRQAVRDPQSFFAEQRRSEIRRIMQEGSAVLSQIKASMETRHSPVSHKKVSKVQLLHANHRLVPPAHLAKDDLHAHQSTWRPSKKEGKRMDKHSEARRVPGAKVEKSHNKEQKYDFHFKGFGVKLSADVRAWQPRAGAWYSYTPRENLQNSAASNPNGFVTMTTLAVCITLAFCSM
mmetsp:Transcript_15187/g.51216  ORF Transcript_15187/g.51216 Transcript_15187/m.51216 type:complete len:266 (+) Transcript_15187:338-1135(+)